MKRENDILEELRQMGSSLANVSRLMPYHVPENYFSELGDNVRKTIKEMEAPEEKPWSATMPFSVPSSYFEQFADKIVTAAKEAPHTGKALPFAAPPGYFEALPGQVLAAAKATENKKQSKLIPLGRIAWYRQWAAAAVILFVIGLGSFGFFYNQNAHTPEKMLATVPGADIQDYLQHTYRFDVDRIVTTNPVSNLPVDNKEIIEYLNESGWD